jgi:LD-carboxypeptidase C-terminal domain
MITLQDRETHSVAAPARWRVIVGPCPLSDEGVRAVTAVLSMGRDPYRILAFPKSDTARPPHEVAAEITEALDAGERVLLANGPWQLGSTLGDPYLARAISLLPNDLPPGVVVGGFHHAHALTELALRSPDVAAYVAPPIAELLAASDGGRFAVSALRAMELLGSSAERLCRLPRCSHVGYSRPAVQTRPATLPPCREITSRTMRAGEAHGQLLAGSLLPVSFSVGRWADFLDGAILAVEIAGAQIRMIDRYMQRLALLGIFDRIGALLVGVPFNLVPEIPSLDLEEVVARAIGSSPCVTVTNAFVGCGLPGTYLRLATPATVRACTGGWFFKSGGEFSPTSSGD